MDLENKIRIVAECLCCSESNEMYAWGMKQLEKVEPVDRLKSTRFIFADQLIKEDLLAMLCKPLLSMYYYCIMYVFRCVIEE